MVLLSLAVILVLATISFFYMHKLVRANIRADSEAFANNKLLVVTHSLDTIKQELLTLSKNNIILNTIIDTDGSKGYILPFIKSYRLTEDVDVRLTICNYNGTPIVTNASPDNSFNYESMLSSTIDKEAASAKLTETPEGKYLVLAYPIIWEMTGKAEGMVVAELPLKTLLEKALPAIEAEKNNNFIIYSSGEEVFSKKQDVATPVFNTFSKEIPVTPPLDALNFVLRVDDHRDFNFSWLIGAYLVVTILVLLFAVVFSNFITASLTRGIMTLRDHVQEIAESGLTDCKAEAQGPEEIVQLADSFNIMVERLRQAHDTLEHKVAERTSMLQQANLELIDSNNKNEELIEELRDALSNIKTLKGLLPICASCKKIRDDKGYWNQLESYISSHSEAGFSHGICPDCVRVLYPDFKNDSPDEP
jgi:HAMP domain-containing protein